MHKAIYTYWADDLKRRASLYSSLEFLCVTGYWPGKKYLLIQYIGCVSYVPKAHTKLKLATGSYILQVNIVPLNQNEIDATCQLCHQADETLEYFTLDCTCTVLEPARQTALDAIQEIVCELFECPMKRDQLLQLVLDGSFFNGAEVTLNETS